MTMQQHFPLKNLLYLNHFPKFRKPYFENIATSKYNICIPIPKMHMRLKRIINVNESAYQNCDFDRDACKNKDPNDTPISFLYNDHESDFNPDFNFNSNIEMKKSFHTNSKADFLDTNKNNSKSEGKIITNDLSLYHYSSKLKINSDRKRNINDNIDKNIKREYYTSIINQSSNLENKNMKLIEAISNYSNIFDFRSKIKGHSKDNLERPSTRMIRKEKLDYRLFTSIPSKRSNIDSNNHPNMIKIKGLIPFNNLKVKHNLSFAAFHNKWSDYISPDLNIRKASLHYVDKRKKRNSKAPSEEIAEFNSNSTYHSYKTSEIPSFAQNHSKSQIIHKKIISQSNNKTSEI